MHSWGGTDPEIMDLILKHIYFRPLRKNVLIREKYVAEKKKKKNPPDKQATVKTVINELHMSAWGETDGYLENGKKKNFL